MSFLNSRIDKLKGFLFGKNEVKNRVASNTIKLIVSDVITLYQEFKKAEGLGALCFNPLLEQNSSYVTVSEFRRDMAVAEENMDKELAGFLNRVINLIEKEGEKNAVVLMASSVGLSVHVVDPNKTEEKIKEYEQNALS